MEWEGMSACLPRELSCQQEPGLSLDMGTIQKENPFQGLSIAADGTQPRRHQLWERVVYSRMAV